MTPTETAAILRQFNAWRTKSRSKTHDGKELSFFVVKVGG
jgi:hypothetical protein